MTAMIKSMGTLGSSAKAMPTAIDNSRSSGDGENCAVASAAAAASTSASTYANTSADGAADELKAQRRFVIPALFCSRLQSRQY